jgi:hypothetical protein
VRRLLVVLCLVAGLLALGLPRASASSESGGSTGLGVTGGAAPALPPDPGADGGGVLAPMNAGVSGAQAADEAAVSAASARAKSSGKPVTVAALTTGTSLTAADPDGQLTYTENVLPVRVRQHGSWVPVSTSLKRDGDGLLAPAAVPGDSVTFSDGGAGTLAEIAAGGTSLSVSWPGTVPVPVVSGSSAEYGNILPGVNLILSATSAQAGGFSSVIEVMSATAARNPELSRAGTGGAREGRDLADGRGRVAGGIRDAGGRGVYGGAAGDVGLVVGTGHGVAGRRGRGGEVGEQRGGKSGTARPCGVTVDVLGTVAGCPDGAGRHKRCVRWRGARAGARRAAAFLGIDRVPGVH